MSEDIAFEDLKHEYISIGEARKRSGLRLILAAFAIPGPWRESCKGLFDAKGLTYDRVRAGNEGTSDVDVGMGGTQSELIEWTAQASAPVAIWNDEPPCSTWLEQLNLAERLQPEPRLIPTDFEQRVRMIGLINEIAGVNGIAWCKRMVLVRNALDGLAPDDDMRPFWETLGAKYMYTPANAAAAPQQIVTILNGLDLQLAGEQARGSKYMIGGQLSALDIYWACFLGLFKPLPPELCPMATSYRAAYSNDDPAIEAALTSRLREQRDVIYQQHLELPIVF